MESAEPVFLLGPPRSGTSLLFKCLCLHPETAWISNLMIRAPGFPQLAVLNRIPGRLRDHRRRSWFDDSGNAYVYGARRSLSRRLLPMPAEGEPLLRHYGLTQPDRLRWMVEEIRKYSGGRVFINKRIANNRRVRALLNAFPDARFVFLVRDGRAVAYSLARVHWWPDSLVWWYGGTPAQWEREGRDPWEVCARHWVEEVLAAEAGLELVPPANRLDVRYEELTRQPNDTLQRVAGFAGLSPMRSWRDELDQLRFRDRGERWRAELSPEAIERISVIQQNDLARYGYSLASGAGHGLAG